MKGKAQGADVWRARLARWRESGLSLKAFAEQEGGYSWRSLQWWKSRIARGHVAGGETASATAGVSPSLVPVVVEMTKAPPRSSTGIEVILQSGHSVRVSTGFDPETLVRLVELLGGQG